MAGNKSVQPHPNNDDDGANSDTGDEFVVEKILDKKVMEDGRLMYLLKWQGFDEADNTWEPERHIVCKQLITEYEAELEEKRRAAESSKAEKKSEKEKKGGTTKLLGFARGLRAEEILGATEEDGVLKFLMKWEGSFEADLVEAKQANVECPQLVIAFYQARLIWLPTPEETAANGDSDKETVVVE